MKDSIKPTRYLVLAAIGHFSVGELIVPEHTLLGAFWHLEDNIEKGGFLPEPDKHPDIFIPCQSAPP